ncbi:hypothetical protein E4U52_000095 [Claviceps spartinae]|nr:hypothetical protein E4U52_000095 [Claviceps spartinae]
MASNLAQARSRHGPGQCGEGYLGALKRFCLLFINLDASPAVDVSRFGLKDGWAFSVLGHSVLANARGWQGSVPQVAISGGPSPVFLLNDFRNKEWSL